jgi:hypothetical protein
LQADKCLVINDYGTCIEAASGAESPSSAVKVNAAKSANGGCVPPPVKPSLQTNDGGQITAVLDAAGDFCVDRKGSPSVCIAGLVDSVDAKLLSVDAAIDQSKKTTSAAMTAAAAALAVQSKESEDRVDAAINKAAGETEDKLDTLRNEVGNNNKATKAKLAELEVKIEATGKIDELEAKLGAKILKLEESAKCTVFGMDL